MVTNVNEEIEKEVNSTHLEGEILDNPRVLAFAEDPLVSRNSPIETGSKSGKNKVIIETINSHCKPKMACEKPKSSETISTCSSSYDNNDRASSSNDRASSTNDRMSRIVATHESNECANRLLTPTNRISRFAVSTPNLHSNLDDSHTDEKSGPQICETNTPEKSQVISNVDERIHGCKEDPYTTHLGASLLLHQPKRGTLGHGPRARFESSEKDASETKGHLANEDIQGQLILNICRSTWTLSDFDLAFNRSTSRKRSKADCTDQSVCDRASRCGCQVCMAKEQGSIVQSVMSSNLSDDLRDVNSLADKEQKSTLTQSLASPINRLGSNNFKKTGRYLVQGISLKEFVGNPCNRPDSEDGGFMIDEDERCRFKDFSRYFPIFDWLSKYRLNQLYGDSMAGLAVAVLNISTSLSAAVVAETSLGAAFKTSIINTFFYALLCSSRHTSFGSYSIMSQMLLISVQRALSNELILDRLNIGSSLSWDQEEYDRWHLDIIVMFTFLIGLIQLICGLLNLGTTLSSFIPDALSSPLIAATAFTTAIGQLANMCGTSNKYLWSIEKNTTELWADLKDPPSNIADLFANSFRWIKQIILLIKYGENINIICVVISLISIIILCLNQFFIQDYLSRIFKRNVLVPIEAILLVIIIMISYYFDLKNKYNVPTIGPIEMDFQLPDIPDLRLIRELWSQSLATALISYTTVHIMSKTYANKLNYEVDSNQELIACGAGNLMGGLFDAMPAAASFSRTAGQVEAGGKTQMASIINCILLVAMVHLLGQHVSVLPTCVMAATLFFSFARMMAKTTDVINYWRVCKVDFAIWVVTYMAILATDLVTGFVYGFIFSILTILYRAQNRRSYLLGSVPNSLDDVYVPLVKYMMAKEIEGIKIFQFCGPIHYVSAELFERQLRYKTGVNVKQILRAFDGEGKKTGQFDSRDLNLPTHIVLDFSMISYIDSAGVRILKKIIEDHEKINVIILIASLASHVASTIKGEKNLWESHKSLFYVTLVDAVHHAMRDRRSIMMGLKSIDRLTSKSEIGRLVELD